MSRARRPASAEALYVLAYLGAHIAFIPFLVLLLPRRVLAISPVGSGGHLLSILVLVGGITASLANIAAGRFSDAAMARTGSRRRAIAGGLACLIACYVLLAVAHDPVMLAVGVIFFQIAVNLLFAPMGALIADHIPDHRKGRVAGLLNCGLPVANGTVAMVAWAAPTDGVGGFVFTAALIIGCIVPLLVAWPFGSRTLARAVPTAPSRENPGRAPIPASALPVRNIALAWGGRFLLQLGATLLTSYLYPYVAFLLRGPLAQSGMKTATAVGWLSLWAGLAACCGAVMMGRVSDLLGARRKLLIGAALMAAFALAGLAIAPDWPILAGAYMLFHLSLAAFFSVEAAFVAEMIASSRRRGRLLGYMNLANTLPAILTATLALQAARQSSLDAAIPAMLLVCAAACVLAAALCAAMLDQAKTGGSTASGWAGPLA